MHTNGQFDTDDILGGLRAIAASVLQNSIHGQSVTELLEKFRSEVRLKLFMPDVKESELRHILADAILENHTADDPTNRNKLVKIVSSGKLAEIPVDLSIHAKQMVEEITQWEADASLGFGIRELDRSYGGFYPGEVMALVGAPGSMKTSLALNMLEDFLGKFPDSRVLFFSLDMSTKQISMRLLQRKVDEFKGDIMHRINRKDPEIFRQIQEQERELRGRFFLIGQNKNGVDLTWNDMEQLIHSTGADFVIIDYFQLIAGYGSDMNVLRDVLPKIAAKAGNDGIRFLLLSQMGRAGQADQKNKMGDHAAGGYYFTARVDTEIELATQMDDQMENHIIAGVTKARNGAKGRCFDLSFSPRSLSFTGQARPVRHKSSQAQKFEGI